MADQNHQPDRQVAEFTLLAETAQRMAVKARSETARIDYLKIAQDWLDLAASVTAAGRSGFPRMAILRSGPAVGA